MPAVQLPELIPPHFPFLGPDAGHNVFGGRNEFGVVTVPGTLPVLKAPWPQGWPDGAPIPAQVADKLAGRSFSNFSAFREAFWKAAADVEELARGFTKDQLVEMRQGKAPTASAGGQRGGRVQFELHHVVPLQHGGPLYDLGNLVVIAPGPHIEIHRTKE